MWTQNYDRTLSSDNIFALQDDISQHVAAAVAGASGIVSRADLKQSETTGRPSLTAYECVLLSYSYNRTVDPNIHSRARECLEKLHAAGVKLYLASGTDTADVVAEAQALGYAHLFEGQIFGAVGDVKIEAKRVVMKQIIGEHRLSGHEFVTFGDGPVEIRETHKHAGIAIGVASDEVRRFGANFTKRARLIRAGADLVIPDFSQLDKLLALLSIHE